MGGFGAHRGCALRARLSLPEQFVEIFDELLSKWQAGTTDDTLLGLLESITQTYCSCDVLGYADDLLRVIPCQSVMDALWNLQLWDPELTAECDAKSLVQSLEKRELVFKAFTTPTMKAGDGQAEFLRKTIGFVRTPLMEMVYLGSNLHCNGTVAFQTAGLLVNE